MNRIDKKKLLNRIEDELFTIKTELDNLEESEIKDFKLSKVGKINFDALIEFRRNIQKLSIALAEVNKSMKRISKIGVGTWTQVDVGEPDFLSSPDDPSEGTQLILLSRQQSEKFYEGNV